MVSKINVEGRRVAEVAREFLGTPWVHQGRVKGVGVDCVGLIVVVAKELGYEVQDVAGYGRMPDGRLLLELKAQLDEIRGLDFMEGDVGYFDIFKRYAHVGIFGDGTLIHVHQRAGKCVEHTFDRRWRRRLCGVFRWRR